MDDDKQVDAVAVAEDKEWDQVTKDFSSEKGINPGEPAKKVDDVNKQVELTPEQKKAQEDEVAAKKLEEEKANETPEQKQAREAKEAEEATKDKKPDADTLVPGSAARDQRAIQRELAEDTKAMKEDIRKGLFDNVQTELTDADGDPIKTIEDVQKLMNPNTKKNFTEEEAAMWLLSAQQNLNRNLKEIEAKIDAIAETNLSLKDQSDNIRSKYGELLKTNPNGIREKIWQAFQKTLVKDPKTEIIIEAPVSLEEFYEIALEPYVKLAERLEDEAEAEEAKKQEEEKQKKETEQLKDRSDRADIYSGGKSNVEDPEEKEWAEAAKKHYEG